MCMEDIKLGREQHGSMVLYSVGATFQKILDHDDKRTCLILGSPIANTVTFGFTDGVASGNGLNLLAGQTPIILNIKDHGEIVTKAIFAIGSGAGTNGCLIYSSLDRQS